MKMWKVRKRYVLVSYMCGTGVLMFLLANIALLNSFTNVGEFFDTSRLIEKKILLNQNDINLVENAWKFLQPQIPETRLRKLLQNSLEKDKTTFTTTSHSEKWLDCDDILYNSTEKEFLSSGWTKAVYRTSIHGKPVAIKTIYLTGHDMGQCLRNGNSVPDCYAQSARKILKEIVFLQGVSHDNIVKVLGYCVPTKQYNGNEHSLVTIVTELGEPIDLIKLLQLPWEDRLRVAYDISHLVDYMSNSPYGALSMNDFRRQQFVMVNGQLKLTDVDDMGFEEPGCISDRDCEVFHSSANFTLRSSCVHGVCENFNEKRNIFNAGRHFTTFILPHGAPTKLRPLVDNIIHGFSDVTMSSSQLVDKVRRLVEMYTSGKHLNRTTAGHFRTEYIKNGNYDLPGIHDYKCPYTLSQNDCTVSVFDLKEAELVCSNDLQCKGFVLSPKKTWTGRSIIHLKNNVSSPVSTKDVSLFIKP